MAIGSPQLTRCNSSGSTLRDTDPLPPSRLPDREKSHHSHESMPDTLLGQGKALEKTSEDHKERNGSKQIITMPLSDPEHPNNWSKSRKALVLCAGIMTVIHSTLGSSLPSNAVQYITRYYGVTSTIQQVLPISIFLVGYVFMPTIVGPISEDQGRKPVMLISFVFFILSTMACAVAPTWGSFLFFRFVNGLAASAPIACVGGIFADINADPRARGRTMALFMAATTFGPCVAPPLSGFIAENISWRWVFGVATIFAVATLPCVLLLPETYAPVLLSKRAARLRKETGNQNIVAQSDLQKRSFKYIVTVVMARPIRMLLTELIVSSTCLYLALIYAIFYLYFEAYPIIFLGPDSVYKFSPGLAGLTFLPIAVGSVIAVGMFLLWDFKLARAQAQNEPWSQREESRRLPLALVGGPLLGASTFWLGWTAREDISFWAPTLSGIVFGMGFILIFMAMLNYLSDAYMTYAASAQGIASTCRSLGGALLPLAANKMFTNLGIAKACSTLGALSLALSAVPFLFVAFGPKLRAKSKFCQEIHALHQKELEEKENHDRSQQV